jgi:hypothetical protein
MSPHCLARIVRCKMPLRDSAPLHPASDSLRSTCVHPIQPPRWMRRLCRGGSRHLRSRHRAEGLSPRLLWLHSRTPAITGDADSISYRRQPVNGCSSRVVRRSGARGSALWGGCSGGASRGQSVAGGGFPAVLYGHARPQGLGIRRAGASLLFRRVKLVGVEPRVCCLARGQVAHSSLGILSFMPHNPFPCAADGTAPKGAKFRAVCAILTARQARSLPLDPALTPTRWSRGAWR